MRDIFTTNKNWYMHCLESELDAYALENAMGDVAFAIGISYAYGQRYRQGDKDGNGCPGMGFAGN